MSDNLKALIAELERILVLARQLEHAGDVLDQIGRGALLTVQQASIICRVTDQAIYDWIEHSLQRGRPIGEKRATWMIGTERLLDYIERHRGGLHARREVETSLKKHWSIWSQPQELKLKTRAAG